MMGIRPVPPRQESCRGEREPAVLCCVTFKIPGSQAVLYTVDFEHKLMLFQLSFGMYFTEQSVGVSIDYPQWQQISLTVW